MKQNRPMWRNLILLIVFTVIIVIVLDQNGKKSAVPSPTQTVGPSMTSITDTPAIGSTAPSGVTIIPTVVITVTVPGNKPLATEAPGLEITPISGKLYDVTGTVNALGCPDSRCKVVGTYKTNNIVVVTGTVMGTTYKSKKTRLWVQAIFHDGTKIYIHASYVTPHVIGDQTSVPPQPTYTPSPIVRATATTGFICPANCDEARSMGLTAEEAGQCPNLDGNNNGLACYGS